MADRETESGMREREKGRKEEIVWKILRWDTRTSAGLKIDSPFILQYPVDQFIKPKVGKIFCFKKYKDAEKFSEESKMRVWSIHKAVAINPEPIHTIAFDEGNIKKFWDGVASGYCAPKGSYICDELKCLE